MDSGGEGGFNTPPPPIWHGGGKALIYCAFHQEALVCPSGWTLPGVFQPTLHSVKPDCRILRFEKQDLLHFWFPFVKIFVLCLYNVSVMHEMAVNTIVYFIIGSNFIVLAMGGSILEL